MIRNKQIEKQEKKSFPSITHVKIWKKSEIFSIKIMNYGSAFHSLRQSYKWFSINVTFLLFTFYFTAVSQMLMVSGFEF